MSIRRWRGAGGAGWSSDGEVAGGAGGASASSFGSGGAGPSPSRVLLWASRGQRIYYESDGPTKDERSLHEILTDIQDALNGLR